MKTSAFLSSFRKSSKEEEPAQPPVSVQDRLSEHFKTGRALIKQISAAQERGLPEEEIVAALAACFGETAEAIACLESASLQKFANDAFRRVREEAQAVLPPPATSPPKAPPPAASVARG